MPRPPVCQYGWLFVAAGGEQSEQRRKVTDLLAAGRRGAADIVEDLAVPHAIVGDALDVAGLVEIDGDDPLISHALRHECYASLAALGDIVEDLAAQRRHGR